MVTNTNGILGTHSQILKSRELFLSFVTITGHGHIVCPKLFFCKQLNLVVNKQDLRTGKTAIKIFLAFRSFKN